MELFWTKIKLIPRLCSLAWLLATIQTLLFTFEKEIVEETKKVYVSWKSFFCFWSKFVYCIWPMVYQWSTLLRNYAKNNLWKNCCTCRRCPVLRWPELWRSVWIVLRKVGLFKDSQATKEYEISFALSGQGLLLWGKVKVSLSPLEEGGGYSHIWAT